MADGSVNDIPDDELVRRAIAACKPKSGRPRWSIVSGTFCLGSTYAAQLCRRFGYDPDEYAKTRA